MNYCGIGMIFVTGYLGGTHGTAQSARDFLRSLLASSDNVKVVSPVREEFPSQLCGIKLSRPEWLTPSIGIRLPRRLWKLRPRAVKAWIKDKKHHRDFIKNVDRSLVFVNGWASYSYWQSMETYFKGTKVLIIRESPRHFAGPDRDQSLTEMIDAFSRFDHLIFVSDRVRQEWHQNNKISDIKCYVLPNCCEEEDATRYMALDRNLLRTKNGFTPQDFIVICPGTIEYRKGQDLLLKVIPKLREAIPRLRILYVGDAATQWGQDFLQSVARDNIENTITHWHARPGLFDLLRMADVLAFPSRAEALPRTILEAMVMKTPVVASSVDGVPELIDNGQTGLLFECNDSEGLLNGILSLYSNLELRTQFSEAGYARYWNHFSRIQQFVRMKMILSELEALHSSCV